MTKASLKSLFICMYMVLLPFLGVTILYAQTHPWITIVSPTAPIDFPEGAEFATTLVGNPWDMNELRDIPFDYMFEQPSVNDGIWTARSFESSSPFFYLLYRGYSTPDYTSYFSYYDGGMPYGPLNPIDASMYTHLSMRMALSAAQRSGIYIFWQKTIGDSENNYIGIDDGIYGWDYRMPYPGGFHIYDIDLTGKDIYRECVRELFAAIHQNNSWAGAIYGFSVMPSVDVTESMNVNVDWIRLYDASSSSVLPISWYTTGVCETNDAYTIELWLDSDQTGYDGDLFVSGLQNDGRYDLYMAALPPGDYYFYLNLVLRQSSHFAVLATSEYSPLIRNLFAPRFEFTAPSMTSGVDYATAELGNPWDMSEPSDIITNSASEMTNPTFADGVFSAIANAPVSPAIESDVKFYLNTYLNGALVPINTAQYRYLTFRIAVDTTGYTNIYDRIRRGWLSRAMWGQTTPDVDGSVSQPIPLLEGWHSYTVDLWDSSLLDVEDTFSSQCGWLPLGSVNWLRFDPLEAWQATKFSIDNIKLCTENKPVNNSYTISWLITDADSSSFTITLYYGYYSGTTFVETKLATLTQSPKIGSYVWDISNMGQGRYYLRADVSDGAHTRIRYSKVPVVIDGNSYAAQLTNAIPVPADYDGDGIADVAVYRQESGCWIIRASKSCQSAAMLFGGQGYSAVPADYDGDGIDDVAVYHEESGCWHFFLSRTWTLGCFQFGGQGYSAVPADYDGDGIDDVAVYHEESGCWHFFLSRTWTLGCFQFGGQGYSAVPADYDGDGFIDPAVYSEPSGEWYIVLSRNWNLCYLQFGASGYFPVSGDYDGDGIADIALYHTSSGYWFILLSTTNYSLYSQQFGGSGYTPAPADYNGDGAVDLSVYYSLTGNWFAVTLGGSILIWQ